jgi:transposase
VSQRRELSSIVALVAPVGGHRARLYARHFLGSVHGPQVIVALRHFRRQVGVPVLVVWDRLNAHRAKLVQAFVAAHPKDYALEWLPPYAPDLNPEELCNGAVKQTLQSATPASVAELRQVVRRSFVRLGRRAGVLQGFFHHAGLRVKHFS